MTTTDRIGGDRIDWGKLEPLKLRARAVAEGVLVGMHRSVRKGAGVEFAGQRPYVPGDDLRFFDRRAMLRHDKLMIREFETETERAIWLVVDATHSMSFRGGGPASKFAYAALIAAATARVALWGGDPVGVILLGGKHDSSVADRPEPRAILPTASQDAFDRIVWALESTSSLGDFAAGDEPFFRALLPVAERSRRGSVIVLISDLVDLPSSSMRNFVALATRGRLAHAVMTLSPEEWTLPFREQGRFRSLEGDVVVEADPEIVRETYLAELDALATTWERDLNARGGSLVLASTANDPVAIVQELMLSIAGQAPSSVARKLPRLTG